MMPRMLARTWLSLAIGVACLGACQNHKDQLARSQGYYEQNQYELSLAVLRNLESDQDSLDASERARYCYLRGMTDYRLEYRSDARYWLGLSRAAAARAPGSLGEDELSRLDKALAELNAILHGTALPGDPAQPGAQAQKCQWSSECSQNQICEAGTCVSIQ